MKTITLDKNRDALNLDGTRVFPAYAVVTLAKKYRVFWNYADTEEFALSCLADVKADKEHPDYKDAKRAEVVKVEWV